MKTRIIHTKLWKDTYFTELNSKEKLLFLYLISNEYVNICGAYEILDRLICFDTGLTSKELQEVKEKLQSDDKFVFVNGWVKIVNVDKYNNYRFSDRNEKAFNRELELIPEYIREIFGLEFTLEDYQKKHYAKSKKGYTHRLIAEKFLGRELKENEVVHHLDHNPQNNKPENLAVMDKEKHQLYHSGKIDINDTSMILVSNKSDTSTILVINNKSEIINNKLTKHNVSNKETSNEKPQQNKKSEMSLDDKAKWVIDTYNQIFGKRLKVYKSIKANLAYWLDAGYSANDIKKALEIAKYDDYWSDKITPIILLRQKNTRGEEVDYIGQFIAKDKQYRPTANHKKTGILEILAAKDVEKNKGGQDE